MPTELDDDNRLEARLFPPPPDLPPDKRPKPDWAEVHRELRRADVTLALLWEGYKAREPDGFGYSWFCDLCKEWAGRLKPTLRQVHVAGEKLFVDYAGRTMEVIHGATGEVRTAQIFVAVLGASSYTLRRGYLHPVTARLDRLACPGLRLLRKAPWVMVGPSGHARGPRRFGRLREMPKLVSTDTRWLERHGQTWRVSVAVPRNLQKLLGTRLKRSLHVCELWSPTSACVSLSLSSRSYACPPPISGGYRNDLIARDFADFPIHCGYFCLSVLSTLSQGCVTLYCVGIIWRYRVGSMDRLEAMVTAHVC